MNPFSKDPGETIAALGEKQLLKEVRAWLGPAAPPPPEGMGDDCAVIPHDAPPAGLLTTDSVVLGQHFLDSDPPELVGAKLLKRSLSDIAAMGGTPGRAVLAGLLPRTLRRAWLEAFVRGIADCCLKYDTLVVGGDLTECPRDLAINLTLTGHAARPMLRAGGRAGDPIWVTGPLGGSRLGRHLTFIPRLREGRLLAQRDEVRACIDISDGLAIDLLNLLPESASAALDPEGIPIHKDARSAAGKSGKTPLEHAMGDGEDHELLFITGPMDEAARAHLVESFMAADLAAPVCIGNLVTKTDSPILDASTGKPFPNLAGHDHFR